MEFVSAGCRNLTGYDPHRFIRHDRVAFGDLLAPSDRARVDAVVRAAVRQRSRASVDYVLRAAHGLWVAVEDRFVPVFGTSDQLVAIEGVIDLARGGTRRPPRFASAADRRGVSHVRTTPTASRLP